MKSGLKPWKVRETKTPQRSRGRAAIVRAISLLLRTDNRSGDGGSTFDDQTSDKRLMYASASVEMEAPGPDAMDGIAC
jgi:hypothetical protein